MVLEANRTGLNYVVMRRFDIFAPVESPRSLVVVEEFKCFWISMFSCRAMLNNVFDRRDSEVTMKVAVTYVSRGVNNRSQLSSLTFQEPT